MVRCAARKRYPDHPLKTASWWSLALVGAVILVGGIRAYGEFVARINRIPRRRDGAGVL
jgi:hypothetical protein